MRIIKKEIWGVEFIGFTLDHGEKPPKLAVNNGDNFYYYTREDMRSMGLVLSPVPTQEELLCQGLCISH